MRMTRFLAAVLVTCAALPLFAAGPATALDWINSPQAYFVTAEERSQWDLTARSESKAQEFIDAYWRKHGAQFKRDVMARIEFADAHFAFAGKPGSTTERGRVWMILGSPNTERGIRPGVTGDPNTAIGANNSIEQKGRTSLIWTYRADHLAKS